MSIARVKASSYTQGLPKKKTVLAGNDAIYAGSYESIQTVTVGAGGSATVSFTSIPSTYKHLQIRVMAKAVSATAGGAALFMRMNSDSGNNYSIHQLLGSGSSTATAFGEATVPYALVGNNGSYQSLTVGDGASMYSVHIIDILDYANTSKYKTVRALHGRDNNSTTGRVMLESGLWQNTAAINTLSFTMRDGSAASNISQYSSFALYGIN
jgi:hypothetical protein